MATSRSRATAGRHAILVVALLCLACTPREHKESTAAPVATIEKQRIDHVTPKRDFVGPAPTRLEWTTVDGVDTYNITVTTEIDTLVFQHFGVRGAAIDWPKEIKLEPGTYFWRVVGMKGERSVGDSGRAAFVVRD